MSLTQQLRDAAALLRERAEAVDGGAWYVNREAPDVLPDVISECRGESCEGCGIVAPMVPEEVAAYIATAAPPFALAVAAWLDDIATRHAPSDEPVELALHLDEPCEVCEDGGHEVIVCEGCYPTWEGMDGYLVYPCRETKAALDVARVVLGGGADE